jgi:uncharacterized protein (TIGR02679 family)
MTNPYHELPQADFDVGGWCQGGGVRYLKQLTQPEARAREDTLNALFEGIPWGMSLSQVATSISTGAHALDRNEPVGKVAVAALASWQEEPTPKDVHAWREIWAGAGVLCDTVSSTVLTAGIRPKPSGNAVEKKLQLAADAGLPCVLTLFELESQPLELGLQHLFGVENPGILEDAVRKLGSRTPPIVCVSGFASVATARLLARDVTLKYHGDFDWNGLRIAHLLYERLEQRLKPWRFDIDAYEDGLARRKHGKTLPTEHVPADVGIFDPLCDHMQSAGAVVYEEDVVSVLLRDLEDHAAWLEANEADGDEHRLM